NYVAHLSSAVHLLSKEISTDDLMNYVIQEHDRLTTHMKSEPKEKSLSTRGRKASSSNLKGKAPEKGNTANATQAHDEDGAWAICAIEGYDSDGDSIPDLLDTESNSEDWFSEVDEDELTSHARTMDEETPETLPLAVIEPVESEATVELYNSGSTHHLSPYRNHFVSFHTTPPRNFDTANQQSFSATGVGDMQVEVLNGADVSTICLTKVLYAPDIGYTLVSIG
ncbi:hypothetical protein L210DRAFT_786501, partial [Boletus edulis BED1]